HEQVLVAARLEALDLAGVLLTAALLQLGFRIEEIDLAGPSHLQEHDDGSGLASEVTGPRPRICSTRSPLTLPLSPGGRGKGEGGGEQAILLQQVRQCQRPEPEAGTL